MFIPAIPRDKGMAMDKEKAESFLVDSLRDCSWMMLRFCEITMWQQQGEQLLFHTVLT